MKEVKPKDASNKALDELVAGSADESINANLKPKDEAISLREQIYLEVIELEEILVKKQDRELRSKYAGHLFWMMALWLIAIVSILLLDGFSAPNRIPKFDETEPCFDLSDPVLITLITTTTINIIGLFIVVAHNIFPNKGKTP